MSSQEDVPLVSGEDKDSTLDTGLVCLVLLARFHQVTVEPGQLQHHYGQSGQVFTDTEILRATKSLGLKAGSIKSQWSRLRKTSLPAMANGNNDNYFIIPQVVDNKVLIQSPEQQSPQQLTEAEFDAIYRS